MLGAEESEAAVAVIRSGQLVQGLYVERFEQAMAAFLGLPGAVAVSSGTVALSLALTALGTSPGDRIVMPSYVCSALWLAAVRLGAEPCLVDVEPDTYTLDPRGVAQALSNRTRAIIVPHPFGLPADLTRLRALGVPLVEDCAQTLGSTQDGMAVGQVGALTICSFYATKLLCTGEGGMVLSKDSRLLDHVRGLREYDERPRLDRDTFNYKMTDLQAAIGLCQVERLPWFLERRQHIARYYSAHLGAVGVPVPLIPADRTHVFYRYIVRMERPLQDLITRLEQRGIDCRRPVYQPLHRYIELGHFPESDRAWETALSIPIYPALRDVDVERIVSVFCEECR